MYTLKTRHLPRCVLCALCFVLDSRSFVDVEESWFSLPRCRCRSLAPRQLELLVLIDFGLVDLIDFLTFADF